MSNRDTGRIDAMQDEPPVPEPDRDRNEPATYCSPLSQAMVLCGDLDVTGSLMGTSVCDILD